MHVVGRGCSWSADRVGISISLVALGWVSADLGSPGSSIYRSLSRGSRASSMPLSVPSYSKVRLVLLVPSSFARGAQLVLLLRQGTVCVTSRLVALDVELEVQVMSVTVDLF